ncbi:MAG TPA: hypothetical protein VEQ37_05695 [Actinomycetota bacterium]|nr:hypothetical protein [Actinomycetota bacterium]
MLAKARRKVLEQGLAGRDLTPAMVDTPRMRLRTRGLRGRWDRFPVSPAADCRRLRGRDREGASPAPRQSNNSKLSQPVLAGRASLDPGPSVAVWAGVLVRLVVPSLDSMQLAC